MPDRWTRPGSLFAKPKQKPVKPVKRGFSPGRIIFGTLRRICTFLGAMVLIGIIAGMFISASVVEKKEPLPDQMILTLRLEDGLQEEVVSSGFLGLEGISGNRLSVRDMVSMLDKAGRDSRVKALAVSLESGNFGVSHVQELRAAIKRFRASGKPAYVFSPSYAEAGIGMGPYYLASAFDQIWMQPVGTLALPGYDAEMPFVLEGLKKIGLNPQFFHRKEYKTVMESLSRDTMSPANREMMTSLLTDIMSVIAAEVSADRKITPTAFYADLDQGIFTDREALERKLVDRLDYGDVLLTELRKTLTGDAGAESLKTVSMARYRNSTGIPDERIMPQVGFVHVIGNIVPGDGGGGMSKDIAAADRISSAIMKGVRDPDIKAILLRIDSPGGSPTASETIRRSVEHAVSEGKPVIVSMSSMAGSGGYWIATHASWIFAMPSTLTGSIGVASGKFEAGAMMDKIGVNWDGVRIGKNAGLWSFTEPFSESGTERMNAMIDSMYESFTARVAEGRKLSPAQVEKIARGRVWTGKQALELHLVDDLGGLDSALDYAAQQVGAENRDHIAIVELPRPRTPFDRIFELLDIEVATARISAAVMTMLEGKIEQARIPSVSAYDPFLEQGL